MRHLSMIAILLAFSQIPVNAKSPENIESLSYPKVTNEFALNMQKNYQVINSYHCLWQGELVQGKMHINMELEVAFERKTGKTLFIMHGFQKKESKWVLAGGQLHVYDGQKVQRAISQMPGKPMQQAEQIVPDPNIFTYRDFRKGIPFIYPWDLPLLYPDHAMTLYPLMEILQGGPKEVRTIAPDPNDPAKMLALELMTDETCARMHLDPETLLIKDFVYFNKATGKTLGANYKQTFISINKPLKPGLFDFEVQLKSFDAKVSKKTESIAPAMVTNKLALNMLKEYQAVKT